MMKALLTIFFEWNKTQRIIIVLFCISILTVASIPFFFSESNYNPQNAALQHLLDSLSLQQITYQEVEKTVNTPLVQEPFNPNTATFEQWQRVGVPKKLAHTILNYIDKKGHFYQAKDVRKIYGFSDELYQKIAPYLRFSEQNLKSKSTQIEKKIVVDINTENLTEWEALKGIGEKMSQRILKYKKLLGGFYSVTQIKEVYGMNDSLFQFLSPQLICKSEILQLLNLNVVGLVDLGKHPYVGFPLAKKILAYRQQQGTIQSLQSLIEQGLISSEQMQKLEHYLSVH